MNKQDIDFKTNLQNNIGLIKAGIWNGTAIDMSYGGTGTKLIPIQGGIVITSDKTMGILSSGSVGQLLVVSDTGIPTWSNLSDLLTITGEVTVSGLIATVTNSAVIGKVLTGYTSGAGTVAATDTILQAIQKLNGNAGGAAAAGTLTGSTLASNVLASSLTSVGTLTSLTTSGVITGTNTTASTSSTTGALKIAGGTGIVGSLNVGGVITGSSITGMFGQYAYSAAAYNYDGSSVIPRYGSPHINANNAGGNMGTDTVYFNLIHVSKAVTINKILAYCGTGGGGTGNVRYGIYSVSSTGYPDQRLYGSGSIAFTGVATTQISVTGVATQLNAGWYFLAAIFSDTAGAKAYALSTTGFHAFGQTNAVMTSSSRAMYYDDTAALAYGFTLQTSYSTANMAVEKGITTVRIPALYFEVA